MGSCFKEERLLSRELGLELELHLYASGFGLPRYIGASLLDEQGMTQLRLQERHGESHSDKACAVCQLPSPLTLQPGPASFAGPCRKPASAGEVRVLLTFVA